MLPGKPEFGKARGWYVRFKEDYLAKSEDINNAECRQLSKSSLYKDWMKRGFCVIIKSGEGIFSGFAVFLPVGTRRVCVFDFLPLGFRTLYPDCRIAFLECVEPN